MTISRMALMGRPCMPCSCKQRQHEVTHTQSLKQQPSMWIVGHRHPGTAVARRQRRVCGAPVRRSSHRKQKDPPSAATRRARGSNPSRAVHAWPCGRCNARGEMLFVRVCCVP